MVNSGGIELAERPWQKDQDLSLVYELAHWSCFLIVDHSLNAGERGLVLPQLYGPAFLYFPLEALLFGRSGLEGGLGGGSGGRRRGGREN